MKNSNSKMKIICISILIILHSLNTNLFAQLQDTLFYENFESGNLNSLTTVNQVGAYNFIPSIKNITNFGSTKAFGFGKSNCSANCFNSHSTDFIITFPIPVYVDSLKYSEMELGGNWGSKGDVYLDAVAIPNSYIGAVPSNNGVADVIPRHKSFVINQQIVTLRLHVWDITNASEIYIDDLVIFGKSTTTDIKSQLSKLTYTVYPNPFNEMINFDLPNDISGQIIIYDVSLREVVKSELKNKYSLNTSGFKNGVYIYKIFCEGIIPGTGVIIK